MHRRAVLGTAAAGLGTLLAGCWESTVEGSVVANETPLTLSHDHTVRGTPSGTLVVVNVDAENGGDEAITPAGEVPRLSCAFLDNAGETLHQSGVEPLEAIAPGESRAFEFQLGTNVSEVTQYELSAEWERDG